MNEQHMNAAAYLDVKGKSVDACLDRLLPDKAAFPPSLHEAMRYCLFAGGKRIRPALAFAAAEAVGGNPDLLVEEACALELIHTFTLIHDDLPSMDNDDFRRGMPSTHKVFGEAMAILAGDALQTEAFTILACGYSRGVHTAERIVEVIKILAEASGSRGIVGGQVVDLESEGKMIDQARLEYIHSHKTGSLIAASVLMGGILGGASPDDIQSLRRYGEAIGHAFQIADDILDVEGSQEQLGKSTGSDQKKGKATYPNIIGMDEARKKMMECYESAIDAIRSFDRRADHLRDLALYIIRRQN
jgi:geranylgeranyl diphosphate synthase type II